MASLNKVQLIGNLGRDPEVRSLPDGTLAAQITLATSKNWKDRESGERRESTEWHRVVFYKGLAKVVGDYLVKGSTIYVEGELKTRKWTDKGGVDRYTTEVRAVELLMLGGKRKDDAQDAPATGQRYRDEDPDGDHDIPF